MPDWISSSRGLLLMLGISTCSSRPPSAFLLRFSRFFGPLFVFFGLAETEGSANAMKEVSSAFAVTETERSTLILRQTASVLNLRSMTACTEAGRCQGLLGERCCLSFHGSAGGAVRDCWETAGGMLGDCQDCWSTAGKLLRDCQGLMRDCWGTAGRLSQYETRDEKKKGIDKRSWERRTAVLENIELVDETMKDLL